MNDPHQFPIRLSERSASTNDTILAAGAANEPEGTTHVALEQTSGRGRHRRRWWSPAGAGLWMSTLLRPPVPRPDWGAIALVAGLAARRLAESAGARGVELHWPNDLESGGRKLGGILCETGEGRGGAWLALGLGLNLDLERPSIRRLVPPELTGRIVSLVELGAPPGLRPLDLARSYLLELWPLYRLFVAGERPPTLVAPLLAETGRRVRVELPGGDVLTGRVEGLGGRGELLVVPDGGHEPVAVTAGDVTLLEPPRED